ncbi:probable disease resistance protein [Tanacetum coccineum]
MWRERVVFRKRSCGQFDPSNEDIEMEINSYDESEWISTFSLQTCLAEKRENQVCERFSAPVEWWKTTLIKMLCHDNDVKGIFGENIIYVTVSRTTSLKTIVQKLFAQLSNVKHYEIQTDEEAKNQLENVLRQMGRSSFCYSAFPYDGIAVNVPDDLVTKMVKRCKGVPLALTVVGASLCGQGALKWRTTLRKWSDGQSIFDTNKSLYHSLGASVDALEEFPIARECFLDLGSFPEEKIAASALKDMWVELYNLDEEGMYTIEFLLTFSKISDSCSGKKDASELEDEAFSSMWFDLKAPKLEVLVLNTRSKIYAVPSFIQKMIQLKVLDITSYGIYPSELYELPLISALHNLKRMRLEHVSLSLSIQSIFELKNLQKLSLIMCEFGNALDKCHVDAPPMLPKLLDLEIDRCYDLKEIPSEICSLDQLEKLSITNCHELENLPKELGSLSTLDTLRLHSCTRLAKLPSSIGNLRNLIFLDISDCLSISSLPDQIGELNALRVLKMSGCRGLEELPDSVTNLSMLEDVICDEETSYLWSYFESYLCDLKINIVEDDRFATFMKIVG